MSAAAVIPPPPETENPAEVVEEGAVAPVEGDQPAEAPVEGEQPAVSEEQAAAPAEIPEEVLKPAAEKYAAELVKRANTTMAAARRAEARTESVKQENARLAATAEEQRGHLKYAADFVTRLQKGDPSCFAELGMTVRQFLDLAKDFGDEKPETAESRIERIERERREEREAQTAREREAFVAEQKKLVTDHIAADPSRWARVNTTRGRDELFDTITEYIALHKTIDQSGVESCADAVEAELRAEFGAPAPNPSAPRPGVPNGATPSANGRNTKTLTSKGAAAAPGVSEFSQDPDIRREQVNALGRAQGWI